MRNRRFFPETNADKRPRRYNAGSETMRASLLRSRIFGVCAMILAVTSVAQEHEHAPAEKLGTVQFATSCNQAAQHEMNRAVALLHSFQFSRAIRGFNAALSDDATCGIAYWGIALSQWTNPFAAGLKGKTQLEAGRASAELGRKTGAHTERERAYIRAVAALYKDFENIPQPSRLIA